MPNSGHGGPPGTRVITIFVFYVSAQIPNIKYFEAFEVYKSREVSHLFSHQISLLNAVRIMSGDLFLTRVMTIFIKTYIFVKVREGKRREGKEGRKEGREEERKEHEGKEGRDTKRRG